MPRMGYAAVDWSATRAKRPTPRRQSKDGPAMLILHNGEPCKVRLLASKSPASTPRRTNSAPPVKDAEWLRRNADAAQAARFAADAHTAPIHYRKTGD